MLIPDFYEILDLVDESMPLPPTGEYLNTSAANSINSRDSGQHSSRSSSKGGAHLLNPNQSVIERNL